MVFDWSGGPINIPLAHVTWQGFDLNADERFRDADYAKDFPGFSSFRTVVILPEGRDDIDFSVEPYEVEAGATRYCMGAAWRSPKDRDMDAVVAMVQGVKALGMETCMTLGMLDAGQARRLKDAGLDYYNHNVDTSVVSRKW